MLFGEAKKMDFASILDVKCDVKNHIPDELP